MIQSEINERKTGVTYDEWFVCVRPTQPTQQATKRVELISKQRRRPGLYFGQLPMKRRWWPHCGFYILSYLWWMKIYKTLWLIQWKCRPHDFINATNNMRFQSMKRVSVCRKCNLSRIGKLLANKKYRPELECTAEWSARLLIGHTRRKYIHKGENGKKYCNFCCPIFAQLV